MAIALLFSLMVVTAGFATLRVVGVAKGPIGFGLAPVAGLAVLAIISSWLTVLGAPPPLPGVVVFVVALSGLGLAIPERRAFVLAARTLGREQPASVITLIAALLVPPITMGIAFADPQVPLSPHDGAFHTETIQLLRLGQPWSGWYPPGLTALFGAWLQVFPWVDSAQGAVDLGLSLPSLAALAVFGLGVAVWRDLRMAALAALLLSFTYLYPYFPQLWSGWPLAISIILVVGMWTIALEYLRRPSARWAILAGIVVGAIVLVHGTELYSLVVVLPIVLIAANRQVIWRDLPRAIGLALLVGLACAAVYVPSLVHWAAGGGAYATGIQESTVLASMESPSIASGPGLFATFALDSLGIDLPVRLILLAAGIFWSLRTRVGRAVVVVGIVFAGIAVALNAFSGVALLRQIYALTFPWGMHYRLLMLVTIAEVLLAGAGGVVLVRKVNGWAKRPTAWGRRVGRVTLILVVTWVGLTTLGLAVFMAYPAGMVLGYGPNDAAAMAWLREHAAPGEVVLNDGYADAGIWAPYKAGVPILLQRSASLAPEELNSRKLVWQNVARLDQVPDAGAAACAEHVAFVYYGGRISGWDTRHFPPLAELRVGPGLKEVFSEGETVVFQTRLACS